MKRQQTVKYLSIFLNIFLKAERGIFIFKYIYFKCEILLKIQKNKFQIFHKYDNNYSTYSKTINRLNLKKMHAYCHTWRRNKIV